MHANKKTGTARLIEAFIMRHYPDVAVVRVHSTTNIFRYVLFFQNGKDWTGIYIHTYMGRSID